MSIGPRYVGDSELPWDVGTHDGPEVRPDDIGGAYQDGNWSLTGVSADHHLFSAVLLSSVGLPRDPVAIYWAENNLPESESPYWLDVGRVVLDGLIPPYDRVVFACPKQYSTGLIAFLDRLSVSDGSTTVHSVRQRLPVVDWKLLQSVSVAPPTPPTVLVDLYGVETDAAYYMWRRPSDPWQYPVRLVRRDRPEPKPDRGGRKGK